jgi:hypothetical protein
LTRVALAAEALASREVQLCFQVVALAAEALASLQAQFCFQVVALGQVAAQA